MHVFDVAMVFGWELMLWPLSLLVLFFNQLAGPRSWSEPEIMCVIISAIEVTQTPGCSVNEWCLQCTIHISPAQLFGAHAYGFFLESIHLIIGLPLVLLPFIFTTLLSFPRNPAFSYKASIGSDTLLIV